MDNIKISILNYENQLLENRKQLNNLIYDYNNQEISNTLITYKINYLQKEIDYMNHQLDILKASLNEHTQASQIQSQNTVHKTTDLENVIGKSWMGIFAFVLIFVSFILFATLLAPFITDTVKMTAMYIVSISFTLFGLIKLKKT